MKTSRDDRRRHAGEASVDDHAKRVAPIERLVIVTKMDLAGPAGFDRDLLRANIERVRPGLEVIDVSARTGDGLDAWLGLIESRAKQVEAGVADHRAQRREAKGDAITLGVEQPAEQRHQQRESGTVGA